MTRVRSAIVPVVVPVKTPGLAAVLMANLLAAPQTADDEEETLCRRSLIRIPPLRAQPRNALPAALRSDLVISRLEETSGNAVRQARFLDLRSLSRQTKSGCLLVALGGHGDRARRCLLFEEKVDIDA